MLGESFQPLYIMLMWFFQELFTHWFRACVKMKPIFKHSFNWSSSSLKTVRWCWDYFSFFVLWLKYEKWFELSLLLFRALDSNMKKVNGVFFKLFLHSLNMKRLLSTSLLHTRKSIWRVISPMLGYLFFGSDGLFTKKEHSSQSWLEEFSKVLFYTFLGITD